VEVSDGLFTVQLNFAAADLNGEPRWLAITVDGTPLANRQPITHAPYALQTRGLFVDSSLDVGIGTDAPDRKVHIHSSDPDLFLDFTSAGGASNASLVFGEMGTQQAFINWDRDTDSLVLTNGGSGASIALDTGATRVESTDAVGLDIETTGALGLDVDAANDGLAIAANSNEGTALQAQSQNGLAAHLSRDVAMFGDVNVFADEFEVFDTSGGDELRIRTTGNEVDIESDNSAIFIHSSGPSGSDDIVMQPFSSHGFVGIRTEDPSFALEVNGSAGKPGGGSWSNSSDRRLKENIQPLEHALDRLLQLRGTTFQYRDPQAINELPGTRIGMVAQEVDDVFPDWVDRAGHGYLTVTYRGFEALTVEALRDLRNERDAQLHRQQRRLDALEAQNEQLQSQLESLESIVEQMQAELSADAR